MDRGSTVSCQRYRANSSSNSKRNGALGAGPWPVVETGSGWVLTIGLIILPLFRSQDNSRRVKSCHAESSVRHDGVMDHVRMMRGNWATESVPLMSSDRRASIAGKIMIDYSTQRITTGLLCTPWSKRLRCSASPPYQANNHIYYSVLRTALG